MNLIDVTKQFATDDKCLDYLEHMRWPNGVRCVTCGAKEVSRVRRKSTGKNKRTRIYQCLEKTCKQQFTATAGTIFHDSHLPLGTWFLAVALITNAKKGMSALQLQRDLGIGSYRTAWYLYHRIREAMKDDWTPKLKGTVEVDETYIYGKSKRRGPRKPKPPKDMVLGLRERGGPLRLVHVPNLKKETVKEVLDWNIGSAATRIMTDEAVVYPFAMDKDFRRKHRTVNHSIQWVRPDDIEIHTNTVENAFSLLKRGLTGNFHRVSIKHLQRYLDEFSYRFNRRTIAQIFEDTVRHLTGFGGLPYKRLTAKT